MKRAIELDRITKVFHPLVHYNAGIKSILLQPRKVFQHRAARAMLAVDEISLDIESGECFGILGRNGAGKSTLLGLISRILKPTSGTVRVHGRTSPLMELGAGLEPQLSGRENIILNGVLLGMRRREVEAVFDQIVGFSGLEQFIDQPLLTYSGGMQMRLGFSVAIHADPTILLVDEVLAVGDAAFQKRCIDRIAELQRGGVTIVLVSHSLEMIESLCDRAAWIELGRVAAIGSPQEVVKRYRYKVAQLPTEGPLQVACEWRSPRDPDPSQSQD